MIGSGYRGYNKVSVFRGLKRTNRQRPWETPKGLWTLENGPVAMRIKLTVALLFYKEF